MTFVEKTHRSMRRAYQCVVAWSDKGLILKRLKQAVTGSNLDSCEW